MIKYYQKNNNLNDLLFKKTLNIFNKAEKVKFKVASKIKAR